jgi:hypothetical protein
MTTLYILVLLLCIATAILFAMVGQLAARLPEFQGQQAGPVQRLEELERGRPAPSWAAPPAPLGNGHGQSLYGLLVLSTICTTCSQLAKELAARAPDSLPLPLKLVLSTPLKRADADAYVRRYRLDAYRPLIDEQGARCKDDLGLMISPALVMIRQGRILDGYTITHLSSIDTVRSFVEALDADPAASRSQEVQVHEH